MEIGDFIALDNRARAATFIVEIERAIVDRVAVNPMIYPARQGLAPDVRVALHGRYLICFQFAGDVVTIVRVVHGARDLSRLFDP